VEELARSTAEARASGVDVRALCIINPGNPTGQVLTAENMEKVICLFFLPFIFEVPCSNVADEILLDC
jgi:bifunctional pyridoxal-dependent enzyme with beta-cystathionase and maltose regulon repressor activities